MNNLNIYQQETRIIIIVYIIIIIALAKVNLKDKVEWMKQFSEEYIRYNVTDRNFPYIQNLKVCCLEIHICSKETTQCKE